MATRNMHPTTGAQTWPANGHTTPRNFTLNGLSFATGGPRLWEGEGYEGVAAGGDQVLLAVDFVGDEVGAGFTAAYREIPEELSGAAASSAKKLPSSLLEKTKGAPAVASVEVCVGARVLNSHLRLPVTASRARMAP